MKRFSHNAVLFLLFFIVPVTSALAAPPPPGGGGPPCWPPPCVPIDKGSVFLIVAGLGLGLWKLYSVFFRKKTA